MPSETDRLVRAYDEGVDLYFFDDGKGADRKANDGIYSSSDLERMLGAGTQEPGELPACFLKIVMLGQIEGSPFVRHGHGRLSMQPCSRSKIKAGHAYEVRHPEGALDYAFYVHEILESGNLEVALLPGDWLGRLSDRPQHQRLDLEEVLCTGMKLSSYEGELPSGIEKRPKVIRFKLEGVIQDATGKPTRAEVKGSVKTGAVNYDEKHWGHLAEFEIEESGRRIDVVFEKPGHLPVALRIEPKSDVHCQSLKIPMVPDLRSHPEWTYRVAKLYSSNLSSLVNVTPERDRHSILSISDREFVVPEDAPRYGDARLIKRVEIPEGAFFLEFDEPGEEQPALFTLHLVGGKIRPAKEAAYPGYDRQPSFELELVGDAVQWSQLSPTMRPGLPEFLFSYRGQRGIARVETVDRAAVRLAIFSTQKAGEAIDRWPLAPAGSAREVSFADRDQEPCVPKIVLR